LAGGRDERVADLFFEDQTALGAPAEDGLVRLVNNDLVAFVDSQVKSLTAVGLDETTHENLDTLAHSIVEDNTLVRTYNILRRPTNETVYTDGTLTTKIRELQITYTGSRITQYVQIQYDEFGVEDYRLTTNVTYTGNRPTQEVTVRT
jgi:hypothetical protein